MYKDEYRRWCRQVKEDYLLEELNAIKDNDREIEDRFLLNLEFGTAGLRGVLGAGTNRMNIYTVAKATQGLANYLLSEEEHPKVAISYDSRNRSREFAKISARVLAANGIKVYIYSTLMPVPMLSFAVRNTGSSAGIMVTASHNPAKYNGYKVYGPDGCQMTSESADKVLGEINKLDIFKDIKKVDFEKALEDVTEEDFDAMVGINLKGTVFMTKYAVLQMKKQGTGNIVNISSDAGIHGNMLCSSSL